MLASDTRLCGGVDTSNGRDAIQRNFDRLERLARVNLMKFNNAKHKVLRLVRAISNISNRLCDEQIEQPCRGRLGDIGE